MCFPHLHSASGFVEFSYGLEAELSCSQEMRDGGDWETASLQEAGPRQKKIIESESPSAFLLAIFVRAFLWHKVDAPSAEELRLQRCRVKTAGMRRELLLKLLLGLLGLAAGISEASGVVRGHTQLSRWGSLSQPCCTGQIQCAILSLVVFYYTLLSVVRGQRGWQFISAVQYLPPSINPPFNVASPKVTVRQRSKSCLSALVTPL